MKKCKECLIEKPFDDFYNHPQTADKKLPKCKECVKKIRRSDRGREMARLVDKKRFSDPKRIQYKRDSLRMFRKKNPEKHKAHCLVKVFFKKNKEMRKKQCSVCGKEGLIHYHHFDYSKPFHVIPCCPMCHSWFHNGKIKVEETFIYILK